MISTLGIMATNPSMEATPEMVVPLLTLLRKLNSVSKSSFQLDNLPIELIVEVMRTMDFHTLRNFLTAYSDDKRIMGLVLLISDTNSIEGSDFSEIPGLRRVSVAEYNPHCHKCFVPIFEISAHYSSYETFIKTPYNHMALIKPGMMVSINNSGSRKSEYDKDCTFQSFCLMRQFENSGIRAELKTTTHYVYTTTCPLPLEYEYELHIALWTSYKSKYPDLKSLTLHNVANATVGLQNVDRSIYQLTTSITDHIYMDMRDCEVETTH